MRAKKVLLLLIVFVCISIQVVYGAARNIPVISFRNLTIADGLSQTTVQYIFQDSDGYMWFGTEDGLNRYDGLEFKFYRYNGENNNGIASNWINYINEDDNGGLWVATTRGLNKLDRISGKVEIYTSDEGNLSNNNVNGIFIGEDKVKIVFTEDGLSIYNENLNEFERILYSDDKEILTSQYIMEVVQDSTGTYWIATDNGLNSYNMKTGEVKWYRNEELGNNYITENFINDIAIDNDDCLWISTKGGGLNKLDISTGNIEVYRNDLNDKYSLQSDYVNTVLIDNKDRVWIGTQNGLALLDREENKFVRYTSKVYDSSSLVCNNILNMYQDNSGGIWIGTSKGISYFNPDSIFKTYKNDPFDNNTLSGDMIFGVYEDDEGLLWVGTNDNGVSILNRDSEKVYRLNDYVDSREMFDSISITDINGRGNDIWISTSEEVIYMNKETKEWRKFFENSNYEFLNIFIDKEGIVWIGTSEGLFSIDKDFNIRNYEKEFLENNIQGRYVSVIYEDSHGTMWIGLGIDGGLLKYNKELGVIKQYRTKKDDETSLSYSSVKDIKEDACGNIWVATNCGLNKYDEDKDNFKRYTETDGLTNNFVYEILIDSNQNLWLSTNYGISRYDQNNDKFINFYVGDGLQGNEFNKNSGFKSKSGEMFFGGISGLSSFYPEDFEEMHAVTNLVIDKVSVDGQNVDITDNISLKYHEKNIQIEYFLPDYMADKKIIYAYKLEGVDDDWIISKNRRDISYSNLQSGNYNLLVTAKNSLGEWVEPKKISIYKEKAPWKTNVAYSLYIFIIIAIIYVIWNRVKLLDKMVKLKTDELNNKMDENTALYERIIENEVTKNNYFINLSHELRTPLNIILTTEQLVSDLNKGEEHIEKSKLNYYMKILKSNSKRLLKLINGIIDTSKIESGEYKLDIKEYDIVYYVEEIALSMKECIESKGIELIVDPQVEEKIIECDIKNIEDCVVNILENAAKFTGEGGKIEIIIEDIGDKVEIIFKDTGMGIDKADLEVIFDRFAQSYNKKNEEFGGCGIGLSLSKQLIELHHGELLVESEVGKGSIFTIILPVKQP